MSYQATVCFGKNKKNINLPSAESAQRVVKVIHIRMGMSVRIFRKNIVYQQ